MDEPLTGREKQLLDVQAWLVCVEEKLLRNAVELADAARALQAAQQQLHAIE